MKVFATHTIDELGRIIIPREIRDTLSIKEKEQLDVCIDAGRIVIKKNQPSCKICGSTNNIKETHCKNIYICANCQQEIKKLY